MTTKLINLDGPDSPPPDGAASVCAACGQPFACGAALATCWCGDMELDETARAGLRVRYMGCLCRACLENHATRVADKIVAGPDTEDAPANRRKRS